MEVDAQGAAALMTPERLASVAGGLLPIAFKHTSERDFNKIKEEGIYFFNLWQEAQNTPFRDTFAIVSVRKFNNCTMQIVIGEKSKGLVMRCITDGGEYPSWE